MENAQNFNENRNGPGRRKRKIPPLKYIIFGGRRKSIRRKEDTDLIDFNPRFYLATKCIITTAAIVLLILLRNYKSKLLGVHISKLLTATALAFFMIIVYQLYMILY
jgi:hypothetical protein